MVNVFSQDTVNQLHDLYAQQLRIIADTIEKRHGNDAAKAFRDNNPPTREYAKRSLAPLNHPAVMVEAVESMGRVASSPESIDLLVKRNLPGDVLVLPASLLVNADITNFCNDIIPVRYAEGDTDVAARQRIEEHWQKQGNKRLLTSEIIDTDALIPPDPIQLIQQRANTQAASKPPMAGTLNQGESDKSLTIAKLLPESGLEHVLLKNTGAYTILSPENGMLPGWIVYAGYDTKRDSASSGKAEVSKKSPWKLHISASTKEAQAELAKLAMEHGIRNFKLAGPELFSKMADPKYLQSGKTAVFVYSEQGVTGKPIDWQSFVTQAEAVVMEHGGPGPSVQRDRPVPGSKGAIFYRNENGPDGKYILRENITRIGKQYDIPEDRYHNIPGDPDPFSSIKITYSAEAAKGAAPVVQARNGSAAVTPDDIAGAKATQIGDPVPPVASKYPTVTPDDMSAHPITQTLRPGQLKVAQLNVRMAQNAEPPSAKQAQAAPAVLTDSERHPAMQRAKAWERDGVRFNEKFVANAMQQDVPDLVAGKGGKPSGFVEIAGEQRTALLRELNIPDSPSVKTLAKTVEFNRSLAGPGSPAVAVEQRQIVVADAAGHNLAQGKPAAVVVEESVKYPSGETLQSKTLQSRKGSLGTWMYASRQDGSGIVLSLTNESTGTVVHTLSTGRRFAEQVDAETIKQLPPVASESFNAARKQYLQNNKDTPLIEGQKPGRMILSQNLHEEFEYDAVERQDARKRFAAEKLARLTEKEAAKAALAPASKPAPTQPPRHSAMAQLAEFESDGLKINERYVSQALNKDVSALTSRQDKAGQLAHTHHEVVGQQRKQILDFMKLPDSPDTTLATRTTTFTRAVNQPGVPPFTVEVQQTEYIVSGNAATGQDNKPKAFLLEERITYEDGAKATTRVMQQQGQEPSIQIKGRDGSRVILDVQDGNRALLTKVSQQGEVFEAQLGNKAHEKAEEAKRAQVKPPERGRNLGKEGYVGDLPDKGDQKKYARGGNAFPTPGDEFSVPKPDEMQSQMRERAEARARAKQVVQESVSNSPSAANTNDVVQRLEVVETLKAGGVWKMRDPVSQKEYYAKVVTASEVKATQKAANVVMPEGSPLAVAKVLTAGNSVAPKAIEDSVKGAPYGKELVIVEAIPQGPTLNEIVLGDAGAEWAAKPMTAQEYDALMQSVETLNRNGAFNHDLASKMNFVRDAEGKLRVYAYDFEPDTFDPMHPGKLEDVAQMVERGKDLVERGLLSEDASAVIDNYDKRAAQLSGVDASEPMQQAEASLPKSTPAVDVTAEPDRPLQPVPQQEMMPDTDVITPEEIRKGELLGKFTPEQLEKLHPVHREQLTVETLEKYSPEEILAQIKNEQTERFRAVNENPSEGLQEARRKFLKFNPDLRQEPEQGKFNGPKINEQAAHDKDTWQLLEEHQKASVDEERYRTGRPPKYESAALPSDDGDIGKTKPGIPQAPDDVPDEIGKTKPVAQAKQSAIAADMSPEPDDIGKTKPVRQQGEQKQFTDPRPGYEPKPPVDPSEFANDPLRNRQTFTQEQLDSIVAKSESRVTNAGNPEPVSIPSEPAAKAPADPSEFVPDPLRNNQKFTQEQLDAMVRNAESRTPNAASPEPVSGPSDPAAKAPAAPSAEAPPTFSKPKVSAMRGAVAGHGVSAALNIGLGGKALLESVKHGDTGGAVVAGVQTAGGLVETAGHVASAAQKTNLLTRNLAGLQKANLGLALAGGVYAAGTDAMNAPEGKELIHGTERFAGAAASFGGGLLGGSVVTGALGTGAAAGGVAAATTVALPAVVAVVVGIKVSEASNDLIAARRMYEAEEKRFNADLDNFTHINGVKNNIEVVAAVKRRAETLGIEGVITADKRIDMTHPEASGLLFAVVRQQLTEKEEAVKEARSLKPDFLRSYEDIKRENDARADFKIMVAAYDELQNGYSKVAAEREQARKDYPEKMAALLKKAEAQLSDKQEAAYKNGKRVDDLAFDRHESSVTARKQMATLANAFAQVTGKDVELEPVYLRDKDNKALFVDDKGKELTAMKVAELKSKDLGALRTAAEALSEQIANAQGNDVEAAIGVIQLKEKALEYKAQMQLLKEQIAEIENFSAQSQLQQVQKAFGELRSGMESTLAEQVKQDPSFGTQFDGSIEPYKEKLAATVEAYTKQPSDEAFEKAVMAEASLLLAANRYTRGNAAEVQVNTVMTTTSSEVSLPQVGASSLPSEDLALARPPEALEPISNQGKPLTGDSSQTPPKTTPLQEGAASLPSEDMANARPPEALVRIDDQRKPQTGESSKTTSPQGEGYSLPPENMADARPPEALEASIPQERKPQLINCDAQMALPALNVDEKFMAEIKKIGQAIAKVGMALATGSASTAIPDASNKTIER